MMLTQFRTMKLWNWSIIHHIHISTLYLLGTQNTTADALHRQFLQNYYWELLLGIILRGIFQTWEIPKLNLFTISKNRKCHLFCLKRWSRLPCFGGSLPPTFDKIKKGLLYMFPQTPLILRVINMIRQDKASIILVDPTWLKWYSYLFHLSICPAINLLIILHLLSQDDSLLPHPCQGVLCLKVCCLIPVKFSASRFSDGSFG